MSEKPSTPSSEQSDKSKKYDRQLRLWGDHGQAALEGCHVCLINASATGTETLKSLVLPGIGAFTILDNSRVAYQDLGNNFFVERDSIGKSRAEVACQNLCELNPDVRGYFDEHPIEEVLSNQPEYFKTFTVVIATNISESSLLNLSKILWDLKVPLVVTKSYGMIGYIRVQVEEHTIIESHPDNIIPDLRLDQPFPALSYYAESFDFSTMTDREHSHVPYVIILLHFLKKWKEEHNNEIPKTFQEKKQLKRLIESGMRSKASSEPEENFEEAVKAVNLSISPTFISEDVKAILKEAKALTPCPSTKSFWLMAKALQEFVDSEGQGNLPVSGVIPDMTSDSDSFIKLQNIYREQATSDSDWVYRRLQEFCSQLGPRKTFISENDVKSFCKNSQHLRVLRGKSIDQEYHGSIPLGDLGTHLENPESDIVWYVMLRAVDQFHSEFRAYPGYFKDQVETDIVRLKVCVNRLLSDWGFSPCIKDDYIHEICRYGAAEVHSIAAYVGGCAAQEVIKIVTSQYIPINNTYIYNAISGTSTTLSL
ncbi:NEDD8-activating enzyme E1 regulatory subunit [Armadillidium vulgare]|nr:NEDD8-activating enzyme E1 regulatory subunit [Armadillidium vulgare]